MPSTTTCHSSIDGWAGLSTELIEIAINGSRNQGGSKVNRPWPQSVLDYRVN